MFWKKVIGKSLFNIFFLIPLMLLVQIPIFLAGVSLGTYLVFSQNLGEIPSLVSYEPKTVSTFYADDGTVIGVFYKHFWPRKTPGFSNIPGWIGLDWRALPSAT
jgi:membrane carboxypeptidase/penicillin-binding protein